MARVAGLLDSWGEIQGLDEVERARWRAAGLLHDALRDAPADTLRSIVLDHDVPDPLLHGPAAAARLREAGVEDDELLAAIAFHTLGDQGFGRLGRALYAADFLEPGRRFLEGERAALGERAPEELDAVVLEVARHRIGDLLRRGMSLHPRTVAFWNALVREEHG
jgi:2-amino-4-hydroxy-6-hydroxymethyldihydropteridine diphosphokinase